MKYLIKEVQQTKTQKMFTCAYWYYDTLFLNMINVCNYDFDNFKTVVAYLTVVLIPCFARTLIPQSSWPTNTKKFPRFFPLRAWKSIMLPILIPANLIHTNIFLRRMLLMYNPNHLRSISPSSYIINHFLFILPFSASDKKLFTPGPLLCSSTIKQAMQRDLGSRDVDFIQTVKDVRSELLKVAGRYW